MPASTACKHTVSGTISLPFRGAFHLSLTVLIRYRSLGVFSLGEWSPQLPTGFHVSRRTQESSGSSFDFTYGALTLYGWPFHAPSVIKRIGHSTMLVLQPHHPKAVVWASPRSLAATDGIISVPQGTEMFQFPRFPPSGLCVRPEVTRY